MTVDREFSLAGQVALVTGSGRGLGHAMAMRLAELGASVAVHDRTETAPSEYGEFPTIAESLAAVSAFGTKTTAVIGDISDAARVAEMVRDVEAALGPISILVNAAGGDIAAAGGKPNPNTGLGIKIDDVRALLDRNLVGTMLVCQSVVPGMVERRAGSVINIASAAGHFGTSPEVAYSSIKAAIVHYTRCLAFEVRPHNVRVNCIAPGLVRTDFARALWENPDTLRHVTSTTPLRRIGEPDEIAGAAVLLASRAGSFITGQSIVVDGGATV